MTLLPTEAGVISRIVILPGRPPFMMAADLAEFYQVQTKRVMEQVRRNRGRFPDDFMFELTAAEFEAMSPHFGETSQGRRSDLTHYGFTKKGALQLSSVLTGPVADAVSVTIIRAFAQMEQAALEEAQFLLLKLRTEEAKRRPIRWQVIYGVQQGMSFRAICRLGNYSGPKVALAIRECLALGLIDRLPEGTPAMQADLFGHA